MRKRPVNWQPLEAALSGMPAPEVQFAPQVAQEVARIGSVIDSANDRRSKATNKLVSFATNSDPEDFYVRGMAMHRVFRQLGILDYYFAGDQAPAPTSYSETSTGWAIVLPLPKRRSSIVTVVYSAEAQVGVGRHTALYKAENR